jgi:hypothetical protein
MSTIKFPGFDAEKSLRKTHEHYQLTANEADQAAKGVVIPQFYCRSYAFCTWHYDIFTGLHCGAPYRIYTSCH